MPTAKKNIKQIASTLDFILSILLTLKQPEMQPSQASD
jgi:hypothetical protein